MEAAGKRGNSLVVLLKIRYNEEKTREVNELEQRGFIHSMMDVKVLILYVMSRVLYPVNEQQIYELSYQDDCLSYFDVREAIPQMVASGHLMQEDGTYIITEKGRDAGEVVEDSLAYPVAQRALQAVERFNRAIKRNSLIRTEIIQRTDGDYSVVMGLDDDLSNLMTLELMAPTQQQARRLANAFQEKAEQLFQLVLKMLVDKVDETVESKKTLDNNNDENLTQED